MALIEEFIARGNFLFKHRSYLPIAILVGGLLVHILTILQPDYTRLSYATPLAIVIGMLGLLIRIHTVGHSAANTSGRNTQVGQVADTVNTSGIYSIVRHPLYLGNYFMWLGVAVMTQHWWFVAAFSLGYWLYYERIMLAEEHYLRTKFGDQYLVWAAGVPPFIPALGKYRRSIHAFNIKKVLRQEKNGWLALFCLIFVFEAIYLYMIGEAWEGIARHWTAWLMYLSLIIYIVLKTLKYKTSVLRD
jgi:protein-S-isoprenylcysteine O-methyltransferase Ste14